jgi:hypothetical protein
MGPGLRTKNREQRAENREQRTENKEQRTENKEQRAENREQRAESSLLHTTATTTSVDRISSVTPCGICCALLRTRIEGIAHAR